MVETMKLAQAQVMRYRSIDDSTPFKVEEDVTCLVGKNESGKTATLQALNKSFPFESTYFDATMDYPSHRTREVSPDKPSPEVTDLQYTLEPGDIEAIEAELGPNTVTGATITYVTKYDGKKTASIGISARRATQHLIRDIELPPSVDTKAEAANTPHELANILRAMEGSTPSTDAVIAKVESWRDESALLAAIDILHERRPKFVYFGDYDVMPGKVSIPDLIARMKTDTLSRGEQALLALLSLASVAPEDLLTATNGDDAESQIRKLENASNAISTEVFKYWSQNTELRVKLTLIQGPTPIPSTPTADQGPFLQVRVENTRHWVTVPFDERSRGFVWFFSFLAYFAQIETVSSNPVILLLDEPGLSLHATAQHDLLKFIRERLAPNNQVIFTTHSPFMVDSKAFRQVRTVVDTKATGTTVSSDVLRVDPESAFPLHAAMGVELTQTLFIGPHVLFVEGPSDLVYLNHLSEAVNQAGGVGIDPRWTVVPGGGLSKLPVFLGLYGANDITASVLIDSSTSNGAELAALKQTGKLFDSGIVEVGSIVGREEADIEDMFSASFYTSLINLSYAGALQGRKIAVKDLPKGDRLTKRVEALFKTDGINNGRLNHFAPAGALLRAGSKVPKLDAATLERATALFARINSTLPKL